MARKRIYTRVRNETFAHTIALYLATHRENEADAVRYVARKAGIHVDESIVQEMIKVYRTELNRVC